MREEKVERLEDACPECHEKGTMIKAKGHQIWCENCRQIIKPEKISSLNILKRPDNKTP